MQKATKRRKRKSVMHEAVIIGTTLYDYYRKLDREIKAEFQLEVLLATGWKKSTFYTRIKDGNKWKQEEYKLVTKIFEKYKRMYPYE